MSDINGTVTGLQGNSVSSEEPTDGYVLTWNAMDGYWSPKPTQLNQQTTYFTSSGTWICPDNVTQVLLIGAGGGGGGGGGGTGGDGAQGGLGGTGGSGYLYVIVR
jgi:hypothetical protein